MENMKHYVQLKDGVVYVHHQSPNSVDTSAEHIFDVDPSEESYLLKRYINGEFLEPQEIKWAVLDSDNDNTVIGIKTTNFSSEVEGPIITDANVKVLWKWDGSEFVAPTTAPVITPVVLENPGPGLPEVPEQITE